ncbi:MAG: hypothetical protein HY278_00845 [candidate division NC10 bacterium]|nr:hypothetical protein [candidate division NC10 bacterium]
MLKTYFEMLTGKPRWSIIAALLNDCQKIRRWAPATLRATWHKRQHEFEIWNEEAFLYARCSMMRKHKYGDARFRQFLEELLSKLDDLMRRRIEKLQDYGCNVRNIAEAVFISEEAVRDYLSPRRVWRTR